MFKMQRVHVYAAEVPDQPGGIASTLKTLAEKGVHLDYVQSQRSATKPGVGELYVAPLNTPNEIEQVKMAGLKEVDAPVVMRLEGDDNTGLGGRLTQAWEMAGINLHSLTMSTIAGKFVGYVTFDSFDDANRAAIILAELTAK